jgi:hypothetical protein
MPERSQVTMRKQRTPRDDRVYLGIVSHVNELKVMNPERPRDGLDIQDRSLRKDHE